ncbi:hypothetical protein GF385_01040 [Candidatus Dependentiae bacterium]|nr:hypothetical protein [Candidatus Dependentiae bacterium]
MFIQNQERDPKELEMEYINSGEILKKYLTHCNYKNFNDWFDISFISKIACLVVKNNKFRTTEKNFGNCGSASVQYKLLQLINNTKSVLNCCSCEITLLQVVSNFFYEFLNDIHPFDNGNCRTVLIVVCLLLNKFNNIKFPNLHNDTEARRKLKECFNIAARYGHSEIFYKFINEFICNDVYISEIFTKNIKKLCIPSYIKALINNKEFGLYNVNEANNNGHSALNILIKNGMAKEAVDLIKKGADFRKKDRSRKNAFETAIIHGEYKVARFIEKMGYKHKRSNKIHYTKMYKYNPLYI